MQLQLIEKNLTTIIRDIKQYTEYLNITKSKQNTQNSKEYENYVQKLKTTHINQIQLDLLEIQSFLMQEQFSKLGKIINQLFKIVKQSSLQRKYKNIVRCNTQNNTERDKNNSPLCGQCFETIQKKKIKQIKSNIGLTVATKYQNILADPGMIIDRQNFPSSMNRKKQKNEFLLELEQSRNLQNIHIHNANIDFHLQSLMKAMQKQFQCKTFKFLSEDQKNNPSNTLKFDQQIKIFNLNQRQLKQIELHNEGLIPKVIRKLKIPLKQSFFKIWNNWNVRKQQKHQQNQVQVSVQTIQVPDSKCIQQQSNISQLQNQLFNVKYSKQKIEKTIKNYLQVQNQLRKQLKQEKQDRILLKQKIVKLKLQASSMENKYNYQINIKKSEISRLERVIKDLKREKKSQAHISKHSVKSIRGGTFKKIDKKSQKLIKLSRPSVDYSLLLQSEKQDEKNFSRFLENSNKKVVSFRKRGSKNFTLPKFQTNQQTPFKQSPVEVHSEHKSSAEQSKKKIPILQIITQINFIFDPIKTQKSVNQKKKQKLKTTTNESNKNQQSPFRKTVQNTIKQRKSVNNLRYVKDLKLDGAQKKQKKKVVFDKYYMKTENIQIFQQNSLNLDVSKSTEYLKRIGTALIKNKSRFTNQPNIEKKIRQKKNLPQIKQVDIVLFGDELFAQEFQKNVGPWPHFTTDDKLVIDLQNSRFLIQIVKYFKQLHQDNFSKYKQYLKFLTFPSSFMKSKKNNRQRLYSNSSKYSVTQKQKQKYSENCFYSNQIKQIFTKLTRFHQIYHKNCLHVQQFLRKIGYYQF